MVLFTVFKQFDTRGVAGAAYMGYSDFLEEVRANRVKSATIQEGQGGTEIVATMVDDRRIRTTATRKDGRYVINGQKVWISRVRHSDLMILLARTTPLAEVRRKYYALPRWLPQTGCYFCDRYFEGKQCTR